MSVSIPRPRPNPPLPALVQVEHLVNPSTDRFGRQTPSVALRVTHEAGDEAKALQVLRAAVRALEARLAR